MSTLPLEPLLRHVVRHVSARLVGTPWPSRTDLLELHPGYALSFGCFVTFRHPANQQLLGCIGCVETNGRSLIDAAEEMAVAAAIRDTRFEPISGADLQLLDVTLTVLGAEREWAHPRDPGNLALGREGLSVECGDRRGLLLPQVAIECGYDGQEFLEATCLKAELDAEAWREAAVTVGRFHGHETTAPVMELM